MLPEGERSRGEEHTTVLGAADSARGHERLEHFAVDAVLGLHRERPSDGERAKDLYFLHYGLSQLRYRCAAGA